MDTVIAVDIGGTKLAAAIVDDEGRIIVARSGRDTEDARSRSGVRRARLGRRLAAGRSRARAPAVCGVGCGGPMRDGGAARLAGQHSRLARLPAARPRCSAHTGLPTWVDNDAKALALGEGWLGAAAGERNYLAMVVSTGIGGGIVLDGRLLDGADGNAGHVGHVIVEPDGRLCGCGAHGCAEAEASGTAIRAITGRPPEHAPPEVVERSRHASSVARSRRSPTCSTCRSRSCRARSRSGFGAPFFAAAQAELDRSCRLDFSRGTRIVPGGLGADGPLIGAACVALRHV